MDQSRDFVLKSLGAGEPTKILEQEWSLSRTLFGGKKNIRAAGDRSEHGKCEMLPGN